MSGDQRAADLTLLFKRMDAEDGTAALRAKHQAGQLLADARLNWTALGEQIEQRKLLLAPSLIAAIKRIDQPGNEGDIAFSGARNMLTRSKQSFQHIAEALDCSGVSPEEYAELQKQCRWLRVSNARLQAELGLMRLASYHFPWRLVRVVTTVGCLGYSGLYLARLFVSAEPRAAVAAVMSTPAPAPPRVPSPAPRAAPAPPPEIHLLPTHPPRERPQALPPPGWEDYAPARRPTEAVPSRTRPSSACSRNRSLGRACFDYQ
jgi:hypothetical protein